MRGSFKCQSCGQSFKTKGKRDSHDNDTHVSRIIVEGDDIIERGEHGFQCPHCKKYYKTARTFRDHFRNKHELTCSFIKDAASRSTAASHTTAASHAAAASPIVPSSPEPVTPTTPVSPTVPSSPLSISANSDAVLSVCAESDVDFDLEIPTYCDVPALPILPVLQVKPLDITPANITAKRRDSDEAILHACNVSAASKEEQQKTLYIVDAMHLKPLSVKTKDGVEANLLTHEDNIASIINGNNSLFPVTPSKRTFEQMNNGACKCTTTAIPGLDRVFATSPYSKLLRQRSYTELTQEVCNKLNMNWEFHPQVKYFTAKLFSGSILYNSRNGQALMANTVEAYGRTKNVDPHRETFGKEKGAVLTTSLPPPIDTLYLDVWPISLSRTDGTKLVVGTQVSNILITSSIRLDARVKPCIGSKCVSFQLNTVADSLHTKIFVDLDTLKEAWAMLSKPETSTTSNLNYLYQLRQIRSKLDIFSAFNLCRSTGFFTKSHTCQPFTIFTLADQDRGKNPGASLIRTIAVLILTHGSKASLKKSTVCDLMVDSTGKVKKILKNITKLYPKNVIEVAIVNNKHLSKHLSSLTELMIPSIVAANDSVALQVSQVFEFMNN